MSEGILALLIALGGAIFTPIAIAIGKFASQAIQLQTLKLGNTKWEEINLIAKIAVTSSEQLAASKQIEPNDKKEYAMKLAKEILKDKKIKVDDVLLSPLIEAQVWETINSQELPVEIVPVALVSPETTMEKPNG